MLILRFISDDSWLIIFQAPGQGDVIHPRSVPKITCKADIILPGEVFSLGGLSGKDKLGNDMGVFTAHLIKPALVDNSFRGLAGDEVEVHSINTNPIRASTCSYPDLISHLGHPVATWSRRPKQASSGDNHRGKAIAG